MTNIWSQMRTRMLWPVAFASSIVRSDKRKFYILGGNDEGTVLSTTQVSRILNENKNIFFIPKNLLSPMIDI